MRYNGVDLAACKVLGLCVCYELREVGERVLCASPDLYMIGRVPRSVTIRAFLICVNLVVLDTGC